MLNGKYFWLCGSVLSYLCKYLINYIDFSSYLKFRAEFSIYFHLYYNLFKAVRNPKASFYYIVTHQSHPVWSFPSIRLGSPKTLMLCLSLFYISSLWLSWLKTTRLVALRSLLKGGTWSSRVLSPPSRAAVNCHLLHVQPHNNDILPEKLEVWGDRGQWRVL